MYYDDEFYDDTMGFDTRADAMGRCLHTTPGDPEAEPCGKPAPLEWGCYCHEHAHLHSGAFDQQQIATNCCDCGKSISEYEAIGNNDHCDDCWRKINDAFHAQQYANAQEMLLAEFRRRDDTDYSESGMTAYEQRMDRYDREQAYLHHGKLPEI